MVHETIIEAVRERPLLYDKKSPKYKNQEARNAAFQEIADIVTKIWTIKMSVTNVKGIWDNLYQQFKKAYQLKKFTPSGSGANADELSCDFYNNLLFLADHVEHRITLSSMEKENETSKKKRSIWQPTSCKKAKTFGKENDSKAYKVPEWNNFGKVKYEEQIQAKEVIKDAAILLQENTEKIINAVKETKRQSVHENSNYFQIFCEKLQQVHEHERDDCFTDILESIEEFKKI